MIDLEHLMLYDGKPWKFSDFNEPLVIDLQGLKYKQGGVPVIVKGKPDGYADIKIAPIDKRDEISLAIYADVHVEDGKLPENYTVGLDINIDDKYYMHPGTNLEINQDKWIVSPKGVWIAEPVTINAVYISEETMTTWLIDGWKNTITQPEQKTEENKMEHTQTENYDLSQPICENPQLALEALKQIIQANKDGNNEVAICMTVKRCQTCGAWPTCRLDSDGQHVAIVIECPQDPSHAKYIGSGDETVKDIIRTWNHQNSNPFMDPKPEETEHKETEMAVTGEMIEKYDWNEPIKNNRTLAEFALEACIERNFPEKSQFDGAFMYGIPAKMEILRHKNSGEIPKVMKAEDGSNIGIGIEGLCYVWACPSETLTTLVDTWNKLQGKPIKETKEEPPKETSLDIMGRNALALPQQAKTIDELEAEADRGLSQPEDVQKLKEANVLTDAQKAIAEVCDEIKELLLEKNRKYGNSALNPCRIFARSDRLEQIRVRIDDKLNRIKNEQSDEDEDVVKDLIGYLVLFMVARRNE